MATVAGPTAAALGGAADAAAGEGWTGVVAEAGGLPEPAEHALRTAAATIATAMYLPGPRE